MSSNGPSMGQYGFLFMRMTDEIAVFITSGESTCDDCKEVLGNKARITVDQKKKAYCLFCADLDHLVFLPSGDPAVTRRSRKHSTLWAVVFKWSLARERYDQRSNPKPNGWRLIEMEVL